MDSTVYTNKVGILCDGYQPRFSYSHFQSASRLYERAAAAKYVQNPVQNQP